MILIGITDIHGNADAVDAIAVPLKDADVVCVAGDITHYGRTAETERVVEAISRHAGSILAVFGNCDYPEVEAYLVKRQINLHATARTVDGLGFLGLGGSLATPFNTPLEYTEPELARFLEQAKSDISDGLPMVMVSHQPPFNTACDRLGSGDHVGSREVYRFIEQYQPLVCFTGHIHEAFGTDRIGETWVVNPGQLGHGRYAYAEIEDGRVQVEIRTF